MTAITEITPIFNPLDSRFARATAIQPIIGKKNIHSKTIHMEGFLRATFGAP